MSAITAEEAAAISTEALSKKQYTGHQESIRIAVDEKIMREAKTGLFDTIFDTTVPSYLCEGDGCWDFAETLVADLQNRGFTVSLKYISNYRFQATITWCSMQRPRCASASSTCNNHCTRCPAQP